MPWGYAAAAVVGAVASSDASKRAKRASDRASDVAIAATKGAAQEAKEDLFSLFPLAREDAQQGFQGALDVFGQSLPAQTQVFQQGNVGAQEQLLAGLPLFQNAILGGQVDFNQLQPTQVQTPDLSFFQQQLPSDALRQQNAALNSGLGGFTPDNPAFDGLMGPFEAGQLSPLDEALGGSVTSQVRGTFIGPQQLPANINAGADTNFLNLPTFVAKRNRGGF